MLLEHGANLEDSQMTVLGGHFTMTLILSLEDGDDSDLLDQDLQRIGAELGLDAVSLKTLESVSERPPEPSHIVTVYGSDHPGIVCATAEALARSGCNITDLNTRLVGDADGDPLYALMLEVAVPPGRSDELAESIEAVGSEEELEVSVRELEPDEL